MSDIFLMESEYNEQEREKLFGLDLSLQIIHILIILNIKTP